MPTTRLDLAAACLLGLAIVANPAGTTPANAQGNAVAIETLTIANEGIVLDAARRPPRAPAKGHAATRFGGDSTMSNVGGVDIRTAPPPMPGSQAPSSGGEWIYVPVRR